MSDSWKVSLPCTKEEAEGIQDDVSPLALLDEPPVLMTSEPDPARPEEWRLDAYFAEQPTPELLAQLRELAPSAGAAEPVVERVEERDWVTLSQQGLEPVRAGRFYVHTPAFREGVPPDAVAFEIEAGLAFGTGQHETTTGCLIALDRLKRQGLRVRTFVDGGPGTGLLAFAALHLWPRARGVASDIDPVAVEVTRENALANAVPLGRGATRLDTVTAAGLNHPRLIARAPYDLIIANILAGPLIELAPAIGAALAPGGRLVLAGLLDRQAGRVAAAYRRQGLRASFTVQRGAWPTLVLRRPRF